jgi:hypothetical protein
LSYRRRNCSLSLSLDSSTFRFRESFLLIYHTCSVKRTRLDPPSSLQRRI